MEFKYGEPGNKNAKGRPKGKSLFSYLQEQLTENDKTSGRPIRAILAEKAINFLLKDDIKARDFFEVLDKIMDRESGKPVATNLNANADITNPFDGIPSETLDKLKAKLVEMQGSKGE